MLDQVMALLPLLLLGSIVALVGYFVWKSHQARVAAWAKFASRHDMSASGLRIDGTYEGYPMRLETETRGSGKHRYTVAVLRLSTNGALPPDFSLEREGLGDKVLKLFGRRDAEIGDERFDRLFDLSNLSRTTTQVLRDEAVQQHLYEMVRNYRAFHIKGTWIQAEHRRVPSTVEELEEFTGPALMLAHTLEEASRRAKGWTAG
jgi:hypothetical protein